MDAAVLVAITHKSSMKREATQWWSLSIVIQKHLNPKYKVNPIPEDAIVKNRVVLKNIVNVTKLG